MTTFVSTASDPAARTSGIGAQFKPFEHDGMYAVFARARTEEPVFFCPEINYWVVTTREDILPMLQDATRFSADIALAPVTPLVPEALAILKAGMGAEPTQVNCDPPKHDRIRQVAGRFLNAKRFQTLEPDIPPAGTRGSRRARGPHRNRSRCRSGVRVSRPRPLPADGHSGRRRAAHQALGRLPLNDHVRGPFTGRAAPRRRRHGGLLALLRRAGPAPPAPPAERLCKLSDRAPRGGRAGAIR